VLASSVGVPWWRVIRANGELAACSRLEQAARLRREGFQIVDGRVKGQMNSREPSRDTNLNRG
jgi:alkylated DNA nucleotide flippase Atl1